MIAVNVIIMLPNGYLIGFHIFLQVNKTTTFEYLYMDK